jgi:pyroglutamyl-peptidase
MSKRPILITGFEPYGGHGGNPSGEIAQRLDRARLSGVEIVGRVLPVSLKRIGPSIAGLIAEFKPRFVLSLGLAPGEYQIRIERTARNVADFDIADNDGARIEGEALVADKPQTLTSTLPVDEICDAINIAGVSARVSDDAGSFLCNACLYASLDMATDMDMPPACGFIHLPFTHELAQDAIMRGRIGTSRAQAAPGGFSSMDYNDQIRAVETAIAAALKAQKAAA